MIYRYGHTTGGLKLCLSGDGADLMADMSLKDFLDAKINSVTRERIFFDRISYDLKMAAARRGIPLTVFEPDVDRDSYDVVFDDGDLERRFQLKTVMCGATTSSWSVSRRFIRPAMVYADKMGLGPMDAGLGGGVILIEIDASTSHPTVRYAYTDYYVMMALKMRLWVQVAPPSKPKRGKTPRYRGEIAENAIASITAMAPTDSVSLDKSLFVRAATPDALMALMGFHSIEPVYSPADKIVDLYVAGFEADDHGTVYSHVTLEADKYAKAHARDIISLIDMGTLKTYDTR